ncbi:sugar ABC transporter permease [Faecalicoccus acidiformans]|uniref:Sugar ABC transporter permease n=1 Tax=Faecalicoccus acidiformans TaxID=915173 RepID=A0ABS2FNB1_9FIRM|nr:sugar ABC transporter permease [Faecalicoccus acidiformans]MBM6830864.1 sugar ABC transporter permease [Faecalicoccus acidiformans]MDM8203944.1 sugar ABC transporter permease [Faecalicoccus acidiformans]
MTKKKAQSRFVAACLAPALILVTLFIVIPTIQVFRYSLYQKSSFVGDETFIGLKNFKTLFNDSIFLESIQNQILIIVVITMFTIVLAIFFATLLTREEFKGKNLFRIIFYIPNILNIVIIAGIFSAIYAPSNGLLNTLLSSIGLDALTRQWMGDPKIIIFSIIGALVWQAIGYYMVMYMASMTSIPENLYEAAALEGAGKFKQFFMITLPLIWDNIRQTLTFFVISTINLSFLFVQVNTNGQFGTQVMLNYMYSKAFSGNLGYGMAIGVMTFILAFSMAGALNRVTKRDPMQF